MTSLSARSIVASTLLGTDPPRLPGRLLVAFAEEFGVPAGTTRVALSRMVERGELVRHRDGVHELAGPLLDRRRRQDEGLEPKVRRWSGDWEMWIVPAGRRSPAERAALRTASRHLGLRELRDGVWIRPDNLDPERLPAVRAVVSGQATRFVGCPDGPDPASLAAELFELDDWIGAAAALEQQIDAMQARLAHEVPAPLAPGFELAAAALRHLVSDPLLPDPLWPPGDAARRFRATYARYDRAYREQLASFFRAQRSVALGSGPTVTG